MKPLATLTLLVLLLNIGRADEPRAAARPPRTVEFNRDVRPILADACFACHGSDARSRKAKLRLDTAEGAFAERKRGFAIKPGNLDASEVWNRINLDGDGMMPPRDSKKKPLTAAQKETIRLWIEQGAKYQKHWSFEPILRPAVPQLKNGRDEARNPIDAFIQARLEREGLKPTKEADRETLIRRVSFALTGLPPTIPEIDEFLADRSPNAYEKLVDRYLASPRYGEEMARHWLDIARYADTHGLHLDNERLMWKYRDWVVKAFNDNLPFDNFTIYQLAGDLLPDPTNDQIAATGFNRCNVSTGEGGSIEAEWRYRNAVDRTSTAVQAWLGLTAGCAVCHDHKFDPLSMKEYYSLYSFFFSSADPALDDNVSTTAPFVKLPTPRQATALQTAANAVEAARKDLETAAAKFRYPDPAEEKDPKPRRVADVIFDDAFSLATIDRNTSRNAAQWITDPPFGAKSGRRVLRQANTFFHEDVIQPRLRPVIVPGDGAFEAWVRLDPHEPPRAIAVQLSGGKKGWWGDDPKGTTPYGGGGSLGTRIGPLPEPGKWAKLSVQATDMGLKEGQRINSITLQEYGGVVCWDTVALTGMSSPAKDPLASFTVWWKSLGGKAPPELPAELKAVATGGPSKKHPPED
ncbi:MAG TPA: DUF1549 domain-containing protein, partial [Gemmata sp.]|nr:DUF1549 domain-containing protein [Gemmata sp.]